MQLSIHPIIDGDALKVNLRIPGGQILPLCCPLWFPKGSPVRTADFKTSGRKWSVVKRVETLARTRLLLFV